MYKAYYITRDEKEVTIMTGTYEQCYNFMLCEQIWTVITTTKHKINIKGEIHECDIPYHEHFGIHVKEV